MIPVIHLRSTDDRTWCGVKLTTTIAAAESWQGRHVTCSRCRRSVARFGR